MARVISVDHIAVGESDSNAVFTVRLNEADLLNAVTVNWSLSNLTAAAGSDFTNLSGTVTFAAGSTTPQTILIPILNNTTAELPETFALNLFTASAGTEIGNSVAVATIIDNDAPTGTPRVSVSDFVVDETRGIASFFVTLDRPATGVVSMNYATQSGTALAGSDFTALSGSLSFAPGETAKTVNVTLLNDTAAESSEAFNLVLSTLVGATSLDPVGTAIIYENDAAPVASPTISVNDIVVDESQTYADFLVVLDRPSTNTVTVGYNNGNGSAINGSDYVFDQATLTFAPGETVKTVRIALLNNTVAEAPENFTLNLFSPTNATISRATATATIIDNDATAGTPVVRISDFVVDEAAKLASFVITLDRPATGVVSMNYATQSGTALAGSDFTALSGSLSFAPGETAKTVNVTLLNDTAAESSEAFNLVLSTLVGATSLDPVGTAIIYENDAAPVASPTISVNDIVVDESQTYADFLVVLDRPSTNTVTVGYNNGNGSAINGSDYVFDQATLTFAPGETVKTVRIALLNNTVAEAPENFTLNLFSPTNATISRATATATIIDNDATAGTPVVRISDFVVDEAAKLASFVITLDRPATGVVSMNYATQSGTALAGSDFTALSGSLSFAPGETAKTVNVTLLNDTAAESSEAFNLVLSTLVGATSLDPVGTAIIYENDAAPVASPTISVNDIVVDESQTYADFLVVLDRPSTNTVTVGYNNGNGSAINGSDYVFDQATLTFAPGETVKTVRIALLNNTVAEAPENFTLNLFSPTNATISRATATATIIDNDATAGTPVVRISDFVVDEAAKLASFVITLDRPATGVVSMNYATQSGTALAGSDFTALSGSLSFAPGETAKTVNVTLLNDTAAESSEAFNLVLSALVGATSLDPVGTAIIYENDAAPVASPTISVNDIVVDESQTYADFLVVLDRPSTNTVTVGYNNGNGSAINGSDYVFDQATLTFAPGETVKTVRIALLNNTVAEAPENFTLNLFSPTNATISRATATATIIDNDATAGTPVVRISDFVVDEAAKLASFVITLDRPATGVVSMNYATQSGTALAGSDFTALSGSLSFAPGETAKTVNVTLLNDTAAESSEAFNLVLSALVGATSLDPVGTAIIYENDAAPVASPTISVNDIVVDESQTYADFLVVLDRPSTNTVTVGYNNGNGSAINGSDYVFDQATLTFAPGETVKTVRIALLNNTVAEAPENFTLNLFSPTNATISRATATATIIDNDAVSGIPVVRLLDTVVDERDGLARAVIVLDKPSTGDVAVNYSVQAVTADGSDFTAFPATRIHFAPGETSKTVLVGLLNDTTAESAQVFDVVISSVTGATVGDGRGHVIITPNDGAPSASPTISVANSVVVEGEGYVDFLFQLSAPGTNAVSVSYSNTNGTALNGSDYLADSGTLTFSPGETSKTLRLSVPDDLTAEATENFTLNLFSPSNGIIGNATATASIVDNDSAPGAVSLTGTAGPDVLKGTPNADALNGGNGNDTFNGGAGSDSYTGGAGDDIFLIEDAGDTYTEAAGGGTDLVISYLSTHTLGANVENLQLAGSAVTGIGNGGNNRITGSAGANTLEGGLGNDMLDGGAGTDTASYAGSTIGVTVTLATPGVQQNTVGAGLDTLIAIENLTGSAFNDTLTGDGAANTIIGGLGNDILNGGAGSDTVSYTTATAGVTVNLATTVAQNTVAAGTDTLSGFEDLTGSGFNDTLTGDANGNTLIGGAGNDVMNGGAGTDTVSYAGNATAVTVNLALTVAQNTVGAGTDTLSAFENLIGTSLNDTLTGDANANTITGGTGNDIMDGGAGTDTASYSTASAAVTVSLALTTAQNTVGAGTDTLLNFENLTGSASSDRLTGNTGGNVLAGAGGNDILTGGAGADFFLFNSSLSATGNVDRLTDFSVVDDTLRLDDAIFAKFAGGVQVTAANLVANAAPVAATADQVLLYETDTGALSYDADGSGAGAPIRFATLDNLASITAADFAVV